MRLKSTIKPFESDWAYVAILVVLLITAIYQKNVFLFIGFGLMFIRISYLSRKHLYLAGLICCMFIVRLSFIQTSPPPIDLNQTEWSVYIDPNQMKINATKQYGQGKIMDEDNYKIQWFSQDEVVAQIDRPTYLKVSGKIDRIDPPSNFGVFDFQRFMARRGYFYQLKIEQVHSLHPSLNWFDQLKEIRYQWWHLNPALDQIAWLKLMKQLLAGHHDPALKEMNQLFQQLGIIHLFSLSGIHLYYFKNKFSWLWRRLGLPLEYLLAAESLFIFLFASLTGWTMGMQRIFGTFCLKNISKKYVLPLTRLDCLSLMTLVILWGMPLKVYELSFQASFLLAFSLQYVSIHQTNTTKRDGWIFSGAAFLCMLPLLLYHQGQVHLLQLLFQWVGTYLLQRIILPFVLVSFVCQTFPNACWPLILSIESCYQNFVDLLGKTDQIFSSFKITVVPFQAWLALIVLGVVGFLLHLLIAHRFKLCLMSVCLLLLVIHSLPYFHPAHRLTILDIGQGDALIYQPRFSKTVWMIDTGGQIQFGDEISVNEEHAHRVLIPALKGLGIDRIHHLIITHEDLDHMGNLNVLSQNIPIDHLYVNQETSQSRHLGMIEPFQMIQPNQFYRYKNIQLAMVQAFEPNDRSITTLIEMDGAYFLNLGDISTHVEEQLIETFRLPPITWLKVAHHGSQTSTSDLLLQATQPRFALISAGRNNRYGHPHYEVLERLQIAQAEILLTSEHGAIQIQSYPFGFSTTSHRLKSLQKGD